MQTHNHRTRRLYFLCLGLRAWCARSSSGGFSNTSWPITSIIISDTNLNVRCPFSLFSGTFTVHLRFSFCDQFSKSSTQSKSVAICACRVLIIESAAASVLKLSPASDSVAHKQDWKPITVSVNVFTDTWSGTIKSSIRVENSYQCNCSKPTLIPIRMIKMPWTILLKYIYIWSKNVGSSVVTCLTLTLPNQKNSSEF